MPGTAVSFLASLPLLVLHRSLRPSRHVCSKPDQHQQITHNIAHCRKEKGMRDPGGGPSESRNQAATNGRGQDLPTGDGGVWGPELVAAKQMQLLWLQQLPP